MLRTIVPFLLLLGAILPAGLIAQTPVANAGPDQDFCVGDTVQLQGSASGAGPNYTYQWTPALEIDDPTLPNPQVWPSQPRDYILWVSSNNVPSPPDTARITPHVIPTADAGPNREICLGDTAVLDGQAAGDTLTPFYTYRWWPTTGLSDSTAEDPQAYPFATTSYYFQATSLWGCASPIDSTTLRIQPTPFPEAGENQVVCQGDSFILVGSWVWLTQDSLPASTVLYNWSPAHLVTAPNQAETRGLADSTRWIYLTVSANICSRTDSFLVTAIPRPNPTITRAGNTLFATGGLAGAMHQWYRDQVIIPGANSTAYTLGQPGCYSVIISEGGCSAESDTFCVQTVGVEEFVERLGFSVAPNPFQGQLTLDLDLQRGESVCLRARDALGRMFWEQAARKYASGTHRIALDTGAWPMGWVTLEVITDTGSVSRSLVRLGRD
ncbi:MAG: hypothetical protein AAGN35_13330 [Bacteroidota bacterium]